MTGWGAGRLEATDIQDMSGFSKLLWLAKNSQKMFMLAGIYVGAMYADAIPAILINTPGTPAAIATTFDGFPLAQKGMAQQALVTAAFASFVGSIIANIVLATLA